MLSQDWYRQEIMRIRLLSDECCSPVTPGDGEIDPTAVRALKNSRESLAEALMEREGAAVLAFASQPIRARHDFSARIIELMHVCCTEYEPGPWEEGRCALLAAVRDDLLELARRLAHCATPKQIKTLRDDAVKLIGWDHDGRVKDFDQRTRRLLHLCVDVHHDIQTMSDQYHDALCAPPA